MHDRQRRRLRWWRFRRCNQQSRRGCSGAVIDAHNGWSADRCIDTGCQGADVAVLDGLSEQAEERPVVEGGVEGCCCSSRVAARERHHPARGAVARQPCHGKLHSGPAAVGFASAGRGGEQAALWAAAAIGRHDRQQLDADAGGVRP